MPQLPRLVIAPEQITGDQVTLTPPQWHYLKQVLRLKGGESFISLISPGQQWLTQLGPKVHSARFLQALAAPREWSIPVTLIAAPPKGNYFDEVVRMATELGVAQIIPVQTQRTVLKPSAQRLDRWRRIAQEATEQSHGQGVPEITEVIPLADVIHPQISVNTLGQYRYLCSLNPQAPLLWNQLLGIAPEILSLTASTLDQVRITVMIGPEGGWTPSEEHSCITAGFHAVSLGRRVLRAATAPIVALSLVAAVCYEVSALSVSAYCPAPSA